MVSPLGVLTATGVITAFFLGFFAAEASTTASMADLGSAAAPAFLGRLALITACAAVTAKQQAFRNDMNFRQRNITYLQSPCTS